MDSGSKLLDTVLVNRVIHQAIPELETTVKKVVLYYIDISSQAEIQKFITEDDSTSVEIELRDLKTVLDDVVIGDHAEFHVEQTAESFFDGYTVTIDSFVSDRVLGKIMEYNNKARLNAKKAFKPIEISEEGLELIEFLSLDCTAAEGEWHSDIGHIGAKAGIWSIKHFAVFRFAICYTKGMIPLWVFLRHHLARAVRRRLSKISGGVY